MTIRTASLLLLVAGSLAGCGSTSDGGGGDIEDPGGEAAFGCLPVSSTELELADPSPLGFSGADVLGLVAGEHASSLVWAESGGSSALTLTIAHAGTKARFVDREWKDDGSGAEIATDCGDVVELDVDVGFATADGAFAESFQAVVSATSADSATTYREIEPGDVAGTYEVTEVDPAAFDEIRLFLDVAIDASGAHGGVSGQAITGSSSNDPDGTVSAQMFEVGTF